MGCARREAVDALRARGHLRSLFPDKETWACGGVARRRVGTGGAKISHLLFGIDPCDREFRFAIMGQYVAGEEDSPEEVWLPGREFGKAGRGQTTA